MAEIDAVLRIRCLLDPRIRGFGTGEKSRSGSGSRMSQPYFLELGYSLIKFFDADPGSIIFFTLDLGWEKLSDPGTGINIPDSHRWMYGTVVRTKISLPC
jgi:hypothetical protein